MPLMFEVTADPLSYADLFAALQCRRSVGSHSHGEDEPCKLGVVVNTASVGTSGSMNLPANGVRAVCTCVLRNLNAIASF